MARSVIVAGREVRLPARARAAVAHRQAVEVRNHDKPAYYVIHADDFAVIEPLLSRYHSGQPVPVAELLSDDDFAVLAEEREADAGLDASILASWEN